MKARILLWLSAVLLAVIVTGEIISNLYEKDQVAIEVEFEEEKEEVKEGKKDSNKAFFRSEIHNLLAFGKLEFLLVQACKSLDWGEPWKGQSPKLFIRLHQLLVYS